MRCEVASCITAQCVDDTNSQSKQNMKICMNKQIKNEQRHRLNTSDDKYCGNYGVVGLANKGQIRGSLVHRCVAWVLKASYTEGKSTAMRVKKMPQTQRKRNLKWANQGWGMGI
ncbi:hypothetical protein NXS19_010779 [Fusarium pseudograminearum]|nr:hypothetical protein NXS19_010779 [Fusarium pseudograminearum]